MKINIEQMIREKRFRSKPGINAGTMADVSFLLLLFFLVATAIKSPEGIQVKLPPYEPFQPPPKLNEDNVLTVLLNSADLIMIEGQYTPIKEIPTITKYHLINVINRQEQPVVSITIDTASTYNTYIDMYDQIKGAYRQLRDEESGRLYRKPFDVLDRGRQKIIAQRIPMLISETEFVE